MNYELLIKYTENILELSTCKNKGAGLKQPDIVLYFLCNAAPNVALNNYVNK